MEHLFSKEDNMFRRLILTVSCVLLLGPAWSALAGLDPDLAVYWPLDEGEGTIAYDASGHAVDGTIATGPLWVTPGKFGKGALQFTGTGDVRGPHVAIDSRSFTIAMWVNPVLSTSGSQIVFSTLSANATATSLHLRLGGPASSDSPVNGIRFGFYNIDLDSPANVLQSNQWYHLVFRYDFEAQQKTIFINGVQVAQNTSTAFLATSGVICLGSWTGGNNYTGIVDDFQLWTKALTPAEVLKSMAGMADAALAANPIPDDETTDIPRDATVSWTPGEFAATHDVYFGTTFDDVNNASRANPIGVLASQSQAAAEYDPAGLVYGQTYYWRVDEVNAAPDNTIFKGETWSFTAEPFSYPVTPVAATASSAQTGMGPQNTINGSGLNANDEHSAELTQMWMSAGVQPNWIQYEFDKVYKLDQMWVWNSNQLIEAFLGFGARDVTVEYSADGQTWTALEGVPEFAKAPGSPTYAANTTVDFGGAMAKFVKLTITKNWGGVAPQTGLSEVRFFCIPVQARTPQPADEATNVSIDTALDWRPGREAGSHDVFIGTDANAVAAGTVPALSVDDHGADPGVLDFATTYFWKVNEVNAAGSYDGDVWSFTTEEFAVVDDFEAYNDDDNRIYDAWIDGLTTGASGSQVGYDVSPFAEKKTVHGGVQAMPLLYDNSASPFVSEAERTFASPQNWTVSGADSLSLYYQGSMPAFAETAAGNVLMNAIGTDIWDVGDQFRFAYKTLNGNGTMVARVESLYNSNTWAKAGVMIRQNIEPGSIHAFMAKTYSSGNGASFQRRPLTNQASANSDSTTAVPAPYWVKVQRTGNDFTGYVSPDGVTWTQLGTAVTINMTGPVLIGLALTSHDASISTGAEFSNISFTGNVTGNWQVAEIGTAQPAGNSIEGLYVTLKDSAGKSATVQNPDAAATTQAGWQHWTIPLSDFTAAGVKMNAVKSMTIGVGNKAAPVKGGAGTLFLDDIGYGRPLP